MNNVERINDVLQFIDDTDAELQPRLEDKKDEAERKHWEPDGKKYQAITEMEHHKGSLKRIRDSLLSEYSE